MRVIKILTVLIINIFLPTPNNEIYEKIKDSIVIQEVVSYWCDNIHVRNLM